MSPKIYNTNVDTKNNLYMQWYEVIIVGCTTLKSISVVTLNRWWNIVPKQAKSVLSDKAITVRPIKYMYMYYTHNWHMVGHSITC